MTTIIKLILKAESGKDITITKMAEGSFLLDIPEKTNVLTRDEMTTLTNFINLTSRI